MKKIDSSLELQNGGPHCPGEQAVSSNTVLAGMNMTLPCSSSACALGLALPLLLSQFQEQPGQLFHRATDIDLAPLKPGQSIPVNSQLGGKLLERESQLLTDRA